MTDCPNCGYKDPFMRSWYTVELETAEIPYFKEWRPDLYDRLLKEDLIEGKFHYHLARKRKTKEPTSVYRWNKELDKTGFGRQEGGRRKNYHLKEKLARQQQTSLLHTRTREAEQ